MLSSEDSFILSTYSSKNEAHLLVYNIRESTGIVYVCVAVTGVCVCVRACVESTGIVYMYVWQPLVGNKHYNVILH